MVTKKEAEQNGVEVGADGSQKIDSMMEKPSSGKGAKKDEHEEQKLEGTDGEDGDKGTKRQIDDPKEADNEQGDQRPRKSAKTQEDQSAPEMKENGDVMAAQEPASEEQAATLDPGKEEEIQGESEGHYKVLERGHIFFFYRPKVQAAEDVEKSGKAAGSIDDVQNTHMLLLPHASDSSNAPADGSESKGKTDASTNGAAATTGEKAKEEGVAFRLIRLGKKRLPAPEEAIKKGLQPGGIGGDASEAIWACISDVGANVAELTGSMGEQRYNTRTRGQRYVGPSRPVGRGWYALTLQETDPPSSRNVKLIYALSHPSDMGEVQTELGLSASGCILVSIRNPTQPSGTGQGGGPPVGLDDSAKVQMSKDELQDTFGGDSKQGGTGYGRPEDVQLLDREGVELLLTKERAQSKTAGAQKGAGEEQADALEGLAQADAKRLSVDDVLAEVSMSTDNHPPEALQGDWI